jgi:hypothetical protein
MQHGWIESKLNSCKTEHTSLFKQKLWLRLYMQLILLFDTGRSITQLSVELRRPRSGDGAVVHSLDPGHLVIVWHD